MGHVSLTIHCFFWVPSKHVVFQFCFKLGETCDCWMPISVVGICPSQNHFGGLINVGLNTSFEFSSQNKKSNT